jgi:hypothetical protein
MAIGNVTIEPAGGGNVLGVIQTSGDGVFFPTVLYRYANLTLPYSPNDPGLTFTYDNSSLAPTVLLYARFFNLLNEASQTPLIVNVGTSAFVVTGGPTFTGSTSCLDVRGFGAVGDGVTDDTAAIQRALNQAYQNYLGNLTAANQHNGVPAQLVQSIPGGVQNGSSSTLLLSLPVPATKGNTFIVAFSAFDYGAGPGHPATPVVSDNQGNASYAQDSVIANGEELLYVYHAPVGVSALTTVKIVIPQLQFNSYISAVLMEWSGLLSPTTVDGSNSVVVPTSNFQAPSLSATNEPDLVIYATELSFAHGQTPTPPGDFKFVAAQPAFPPNGLNSQVPVMAVAYQNWTGKQGLGTASGANENWQAPGYDGVASMVAYRLMPTTPAPPGKTTVCIPQGVSCMVSPQITLDHNLGPDSSGFKLPWASQNSLFTLQCQRYTSMAYSLVMFDGITLEIDGAVVANPSTNADVISGGLNEGGEFGWALFMNSAWLLNTTLGTQLIKPDLGNSDIPWNSYLAGQAFNEGPRNTGFRITGSGKVYLNGQIQAALPTDVFDGVTHCGFPNVSLARFYCADNSSIDGIEILNPWGLAIEWGHSDNVSIDNLYIHDAPNIPSAEIGSTTAQTTGIIEMDMLRSSKITNNRIVNCPVCIGTIDWAGFQNLIIGNEWNNCLGGYQYNDMGGEWPWVFGPPLINGTYQPSYQGNTYSSVTHNTEIAQNTAINCVTAPASVETFTQSPPGQAAIILDFGSDGFGFEAGSWFFLPAGGFVEALFVTGTGFHDNIASGSSTDIFFGPLMAFKSNLNNGTGGSPVTNGTNTVTNEVPSGVIDGTNKIFTFAHIPVAGSLVLLLNGLTEASGSDYLPNGNQITMVVAPNPGSTLTGSYQYLAGN